ncbi:excinuclease ABC subunit UvrA [Xiashengella succiniciproducens]|jgi:excinuclease ABC subunit A|uniref:UvrABC system protein A n=1 Tax=Xiashengella succiniciproducens TaxID=2949635 RepID=A0A9J6ZMQ2_9BACT|nr:excinuclease ABC subunit UvrA [Alkaliflexus sp. Ai-910]MDI9539610.1 excinuclease ABC subunit UvrA [Bacteroidota bacterium]URW79156.1 excinuclease ABC subunit UvrA [Alkaliflexus sp. Ai-910]HHU01017.1 excinuclease ABC subunit UvrA [Bacteroidales bacterium]
MLGESRTPDVREPAEAARIDIYGARVHNLKNIDVSIPRNKLVVITGLSGSGKSSLAFDTIYAEGQRRYIETFSAYARQFLGSLERPDVDKITGLSPVISIEQKTTSRNPRSTVGTVTEIYDFLRLLYARAGEAFSYVSGEKMVRWTDSKILEKILSDYEGKAVYILAPVVKGRKGHYKELFEHLRRKGFINVRVDGEITEIKHNMRVDRYKNHFIEVVIDKLVVEAKDRKRLEESVKLAMKQGSNVMMLIEKDNREPRYFSRLLMCPVSGISYSEPAPHSFSFNSPQGACPKCKGLGVIKIADLDKIIPDPKLSIYKGGILPLGKHREILIFWQLEALAEKYGFTLKTNIENIPEEALDAILYGTNEPLTLKNTPLGTASGYYMNFNGVIKYLQDKQDSESDDEGLSGRYITEAKCPECNGARLNKEALHYRIDGKNIAELAGMDLSVLSGWLVGLEDRLSDKQKQIATEILKEIRSRLGFMLDVGLEYLSLDRSASTLSGGESQRIRLATQIGSQLVNVLYILDEPSIGLHQRDNHRLIESLKQLRDNGNSVLVVEHDRDMMMAADQIIDMGPFAGRHGGKVVSQGSPEDILKSESLTAEYLRGIKTIPVPEKRREGNGKSIKIIGAKGNNLKNISVEFPLGKLICVTGVSGSGKSTLVNETLYPILNKHIYNGVAEPLPYKEIIGLENIDKVVDVDQSPLGRTPRSNPATYTKLFDEIRKLFAELPESKIRNYKPGRFSFNIAGGRCETCKGGGMQIIEMNFLPDVTVECPDCGGKRYNRETLEVRFKGKSISDVLDMTINQSVEFFENIPKIYQKVRMMQQVGLGYIKLGQSSTTLSGGESQRVKLSSELARKDTGKTLYILDEPTTGLHFEDIRVLLEVLNKLVDRGNTVIVIEHNLDVVKAADYIIDIGPEGGSRGGEVLACGTPEEIALVKKSYTGQFLLMEPEFKHLKKK